MEEFNWVIPYSFGTIYIHGKAPDLESARTEAVRRFLRAWYPFDMNDEERLDFIDNPPWADMESYTARDMLMSARSIVDEIRVSGSKPEITENDMVIDFEL